MAEGELTSHERQERRRAERAAIDPALVEVSGKDELMELLRDEYALTEQQGCGLLHCSRQWWHAHVRDRVPHVRTTAAGLSARAMIAAGVPGGGATVRYRTEDFLDLVLGSTMWARQTVVCDYARFLRPEAARAAQARIDAVARGRDAKTEADKALYVEGKIIGPELNARIKAAMRDADEAMGAIVRQPSGLTPVALACARSEAKVRTYTTRRRVTAGDEGPAEREVEVTIYGMRGHRGLIPWVPWPAPADARQRLADGQWLAMREVRQWLTEHHGYRPASDEEAYRQLWGTGAVRATLRLPDTETGELGVLVSYLRPAHIVGAGWGRRAGLAVAAEVAGFAAELDGQGDLPELVHFA